MNEGAPGRSASRSAILRNVPATIPRGAAGRMPPVQTGRLVFKQYAGSLQIEIKNFRDLQRAVEAPQTLWVATACPTDGMTCDPRFLKFLDGDNNMRVRAQELKAAVELVGKMLRNHAGVDEASDRLDLTDLSDDAEALRATAEVILESLGQKGAGSITLEQIRKSEQSLKDAHAHGDGIVSPPSIKDAELAELAGKIVPCFPEVKNKAGQPGFDLAMLEAFRKKRAEAKEHLGKQAELFAWGESSLERARQLLALRARVDEYFLQCRLVATQPEAAERFRLNAERLEALVGDPGGVAKALAALPIAPPRSEGVLRWAELYRGAEREGLEVLRRDVIAAVIGDSGELLEGEWHAVAGKAQAIADWQARLDAEPVFKLGPDLDRLDEEAIGKLEALCKADLDLKEKIASIDALERLVLYQRWLLPFANNFISMPDLYETTRRALFETGTLILSGREFALSVLVPDRAAHVKLAEEGTLCLAYVKIQEGDPTKPVREVAVPITSGTSQGVVVGKRGVFVDHLGNQLDATVTHVVLRPVSLFESMTQPFQRIGKFLSSKIEALSQAGEKSLDTTLEKTYTAASAAPAPKPGAPPAPVAPAAAPGGALGGMLAGGGLAIAAIGSSLAFVLGQLKKMTVLDVFNAVIAIVAVVSVPAGLVGWMKLRKRNLATVLEGSGWALNDRLLLTRALGALITRRPARPRGSVVDRADIVKKALVVRRGQGEHEEQRQVGRTILLAIGLALLVTWQYREIWLPWVGVKP